MNDFAIIYNYLMKCSNKFLKKFKRNNTHSTFSEILLQPDGAKYLNSVFMGKNKIYGYNTTLYKIKRENEDFYFASYIYKKNFTQVILTDDWEKMRDMYQSIHSNNQPVIINIDKREGGGVKYAAKNKFGRKRL